MNIYDRLVLHITRYLSNFYNKFFSCCFMFKITFYKYYVRNLVIVLLQFFIS